MDEKYPKVIWSDQEPSPTILEEARKFVHFRVAGTLSIEEVRDESFGNRSPGMIVRYRRGLEAVERIAHEPPEGASLAEVVKWDAGWMLPNDTEEEARLWLLEFAEFVREVLGEHAPPRKYPAEVPRPRRYFFPE